MVARRFRILQSAAIAFLAAVIVAVVWSAKADAIFSDSYCGSVYTPAHGWCWYSQFGSAHSWTSNWATYTGSGSFDICAAISVYPHGTTLSKYCGPNQPTGTDAFTSYCGSPTLQNKDAGVGNTDNNQHHIGGYAQTGGC